MDELSELRERIAVLEQRLAALQVTASVASEEDAEGERGQNHDTGAPVAAVGGGSLTAYDVVWYPKSGVTPAWYVYYPGSCFEYHGMSPTETQPTPDSDGFVGLASQKENGAVYVHAVIELDGETSVEKSVKCLYFDTNATREAGEDEKVVNVKIAEISDSSVRQIVKGRISIGKSKDVIDNVSVGTVTSESASDKSALQIKNFDNDESDGSQGLCERISVVKEGEDSYKLSAGKSGSTVWILARVNGALKYIPLTGSEDPDPDESPDDSDSCHDHPGDADGVTPSDGGGISGHDDESTGQTTVPSDVSGVDVVGGNPVPDEDVIVSTGSDETVEEVDGEPSGGVEPSGGEGHEQSACGDCN